MFFKQKYMVKTENTYIENSERITRLKKFHVEALNLTCKIHITFNSYSIFEKYPIKKLFLKRWVLTLGS